MNIDNILSKMSLRNKIEQLTQIVYTEGKYEKIKERLKKECIGSLILSTNATAGNTAQEQVNIERINELQKISMEYHNIPLIFGRDVIHGHHISLPVPLGMSASFNPELIKEGYKCVAEEAKNDGINWAFSPMLDVSRDPRWGRIIEGTGEDPYVGEKMAEAVVTGFQGDGEFINVAACAKHYVGYGASEGGRDYHRAEISEYSLRNFYLRAFHSAVKSGVATIMNSFNEVSGQPTASSKFLLTDVLRGEMGFEGFVVSDWAAVERLVNQGVAETRKHAAALAVNAGLDMDMVSECFYDSLEEALKDNLVVMETIDMAVRRILEVKQKMNLFDNPYCIRKDYSKDYHREIARRIEEESIVMLKNNDILPLSGNEKLCIIGNMTFDIDNIVGSWELDYDKNESVSIYDGLKQFNCDLSIYDFECPKCGVLDKLKNADAVIVVIGESKFLTGEANSISMIEIPEEQKIMIDYARKFGKKVIGVMMYGRPRAMGDVIDKFDAVLYCWHGGSQTGNAVANIIFGKCSPSGKLPVTLPRSTGQIPIFYNLPPLVFPEITGYYDRTGKCPNYWDEHSSPLYPFGYGLSYAEFEYGDISTDNEIISLDDLISGKKIKISIKVSNTGNFDAYETVQCYVRDCFSSMTRPIKELKGFRKEFFNKSEIKVIEFELGWEELGFYNAEGKYVVEPGEFKIYIGGDCTTENFIMIKVL